MRSTKANILIIIFISLLKFYDAQGMCKLKDEKMYPKPAVLTTLMALRTTFSENFIAFFDLVEKCKNPDYSYPPCGPQMGGKVSIEYLYNIGLVDAKGDLQHELVRNIILASIEDDGLDLRLVNPISEDFTEKKDSSPIQFCIPAPMDEYWNTGYPKQILEVIDENPEAPWGSLKIIAPEDFRKCWPSICKKYVIKCSGPAQNQGLPYIEYVSLIHSLRPEIPLPKGFKKEKLIKLESDRGLE